MYASDVTSKVDLGAHVVTIRKLGWKALREAREAKSEADFHAARRITTAIVDGGPTLAKLWGLDRPAPPPPSRDTPKGESETPAAAPDDAPAPSPAPAKPVVDVLRELRYRQYDQGVVLHAGVKAYDGKPVVQDAIDEIEEPAADALFKAILDLSLPPLDPAAQEAERKNA